MANVYFSPSHQQTCYVLRSNSVHLGWAWDEETIGYTRFPLISVPWRQVLFYFIFYFQLLRCTENSSN